MQLAKKLLGAFLLLVPSVCLADFSGYTYQRTITIDHTQVSTMAATLSDFPVLISTTGVYASTSASGGRLTGSGYDLVYSTRNNCDFLLNWDTETVNYSGTVARNEWVKVPSVSSTTDTVFYQCYGNSSITTYQGVSKNTWDSNYLGVWHMADGSTLSAKDSTGNGWDGTFSATPPTAGTGQIDGDGVFVKASQEKITLAAHTAIQNFTVSAWVKPNGNQVAGAAILTDIDNTTYINYVLSFINTANTLTMWAGFLNDTNFFLAQYPSALTNGAWAYMTTTYDQSKIWLFKNATTPVGNNCGAQLLKTNGTGVRIGHRWDNGDTTSMFNGDIDEVRVSNIARPWAWVQTEYNNQLAPNTFLAFGNETTGGGGPPTTNPSGTIGTRAGTGTVYSLPGSGSIRIQGL